MGIWCTQIYEVNILLYFFLSVCLSVSLFLPYLRSFIQLENSRQFFSSIIVIAIVLSMFYVHIIFLVYTYHKKSHGYRLSQGFQNTKHAYVPSYILCAALHVNSLNLNNTCILPPCPRTHILLKRKRKALFYFLVFLF